MGSVFLVGHLQGANSVNEDRETDRRANSDSATT